MSRTTSTSGSRARLWRCPTSTRCSTRQAGFTKAQVIDYYVRIAPVLLPHLRAGRSRSSATPTASRASSSTRSSCPLAPPDVGATSPMSPATASGHDRLLHWSTTWRRWCGWPTSPAWSCTRCCRAAGAPSRPTMMVFDLDPGPPADVAGLLPRRPALRTLLERAGPGVPREDLRRQGPAPVRAAEHARARYDQTKSFVARRGRAAWREHCPERGHRQHAQGACGAGKVFIDWSQNDEHKTTVCAYSLRAQAAADGVHAVTWDEVDAAVKREDTSGLVIQAPAHARPRGKARGPLRPTLKLKQKLPEVG